jgi:hypothetical protein
MSVLRSKMDAVVAGCVVITVLGLAIAYDANVGHGPAKAVAVPVPSRIEAGSSVSDILRFAETSGSRWRSLRVSGHEGPTGAAQPFDVQVERSGRSRSEQGGVVRVRNGAVAVRLDATSKTVTRGQAPRVDGAADAALDGRMAAHRANDPTLSRPGERLLDTPVNDLVSPAGLIRKELGLAATSVSKRGTATVAGREALVLEARFPKELAKEDHWDVYVDVETGIILRLVIEPLPGGTRFESSIDTVEVDPALAVATFDTSVPSGYMEVPR